MTLSGNQQETGRGYCLDVDNKIGNLIKAARRQEINMKTKTQAIGRTLSIDELTQVSGGHNPPDDYVGRTATRATGIPPFILVGVAVPPDPYVVGR